MPGVGFYLQLIRFYTTNAKRSVLLQDVHSLKRWEMSRGSRDRPEAYVWGQSHTGALGLKNITKVDAPYDKNAVHYPMKLRFFEKLEVTGIAAGYGFSAFATKSESGVKLLGTGINTDGQLGSGHRLSKIGTIVSPTSIELPLEDGEQLEGVKSMSAGRAHLVVVSNKGTVYTLGNNSYGQCARKIIAGENYGDSGVIHRIDGFAEGDVESAECGQDHTILRTKSGRLYSCGWGADGQTGLATYDKRGELTEVEGDVKGEKILKVSSRADCVLAVNEAGEVFGWGNSEYGQLSETDDSPTQVHTPKFLSITKGLGKIIDIAAGGSMCIALNDSGDVFTWGYGILGFGSNVERSSKPRHISPALLGCTGFNADCKVISVDSGIFHMGAINSEGDLFMWGTNRFGCLGLGHNKNQYFPFKTAVNAKVEKVSCGVDHSLAICRPYV